MDSVATKTNPLSVYGTLPLCPLCGREFDNAVTRTENGWNCACGEFIPDGIAINPFEGCSCGLSCNCGREMRR